MYLGIDIGTSSVKAVIIDDKGLLIESHSVDLAISRPQPLWSEQNPEDWWTSADMAVKGLSISNRRNVQSIGLTGQMHGATLLDQNLEPLRPAILWNDGRSFLECSELQESQSDFMDRGGNLVMPGFTAPKLQWVRKNEPALFAKVAKVLLPKDYIRLRMSGELASDMSDSAGTLWMDVKARDWHDPLLDACGLSRDHMPNLYEGIQQTGNLRPEIANDWGMGRVPIIAGGGDNAAGAIGAGVVNDGDALMSLGTSGVIFVASNDYRSNPSLAAHAFCHAVPDRWHLMSVMLSAASCLDWAMKVTGIADAGQLIACAQSDSGIGCTASFLPYLSGERSPHNNPYASGVLFGLNHDAGAGEIAQSVLEGVAFGMADGFDSLLQTGVNVDQISVIGGGSQSHYWGQILAAALNRPLVYREGAASGPAFGAARLARHAIVGGSFDTSFAPPTVTEVIEPRSEIIEKLAAKKAQFSRLYKLLQSEFTGEANG